MTGRNLLTLNLVDKRPPSPQLQENTSGSWNRWDEFRNASSGTDDSLFADPLDRARPKRLPWLCASLALQTLVFGSWMLYSITAESELPPPRVVTTFLTVAPLAPTTPSPPPAIAASSSSAPVADTRSVSTPFLQLADITPTTMPMEIANDPGFGFDSGSQAGVPRGAIGGVVGGLVGGLGEAPPPLPPPSEPTIYVVSGELKRPAKLIHVDPVYPAIATMARVEGVVILEALIDDEGNVDEVKVLRSIPLLDDAALEAVKSWKYAPTIIGGKPVPIQMTVTVKFALA